MNELGLRKARILFEKRAHPFWKKGRIFFEWHSNAVRIACKKWVGTFQRDSIDKLKKVYRPFKKAGRYFIKNG